MVEQNPQTMEWVAPFYDKQYRWLDEYLGDIQEHHRARAATIGRFAGPAPMRVLELGAGGGQVAAAAADLGHDVTAVELVPVAARHAETLAALPHPGSMTVVHGDFYEVELDGPFDLVCYWDGFGIGSDDDQRRLLARVLNWLAPDGCALIDVYTPCHWAQAVGREMRFAAAVRRYDFDAEGCRMLDQWRPLDEESATQVVTQSLRCYSPADLALLLHGIDLSIESIEPGGTIDLDGRYHATAPLHQAMSYTAKLVRS